MTALSSTLADDQLLLHKINKPRARFFRLN